MAMSKLVPPVKVMLILWPALVLLIASALVAPSVMRWHLLDQGLYARYSALLLQGKLPYRDFSLEYPPLALVAFTIPRLFGFAGSVEAYAKLFVLANTLYVAGIASLLIGLLLAWQPERRPLITPLLWYSLLIAILSPLLPWRFDLFPALLSVAGVWLLVRDKPGWAGALLGLGIAAKLYPLVLVPVCGVWLLTQRSWRDAVRFGSGCAVAILLVLLPFLLSDPFGWLSFLRYHELRGLQIESVLGGLFCLGHVLGWSSLNVGFSNGAMHLQAPLIALLMDWLVPLLMLIYAIAMGCWWWGFRQSRRLSGSASTDMLIHAVVTALLIFIACNKVFSPQYMIWVLPFIPLLRWRFAVVLTLICGLTILLFPFLYEQLLRFELLPILILNLRNGLVVALIPWLLFDMLRPNKKASGRISLH